MSRVLVVDDEQGYCDELKLGLSREGHEVETANSGRAAIDLGARYRPDVLVADWMLKNHIHGLHVADVLRSVMPELQAILITGFASDHLRSVADRTQVFDFIEKPFRLDRLRSAVRLAGASPAVERDCPLFAMIEVDSRGSITFANAEARELFGQTRGGPDAANLADHFPPGEMPDLDEAIDHWVVVDPRPRQDADERITWHLRSQRPRDRGNRLVVLRRQDDPQHIGHSLMEMLLGLKEPKDPRWPFEARVLLVDDNALVRSSLVSALEMAGAGCYAVETPREALRLLEADDGLEFVVHDFDLAGGSAAQSVAAIRAARPDVTIVGMSGSDRRADFAQLGVEHFLRKPWRVDDLINVVTGRIGHCAECDLPIPLRRPRPGETGKSWECAYCRTRYRAVFDDDAPPDTHHNVRPG